MGAFFVFTTQGSHNIHRYVNPAFIRGIHSAKKRHIFPYYTTFPLFCKPKFPPVSPNFPKFCATGATGLAPPEDNHINYV